MPHGSSAIEATPAVSQGGGRGPEALRRMIRSGVSFSGHERNCCFLNTRTPRFADVSAVSGLDFPDDARGVARVDWDSDGDLDLWVSNRSGPQVRFLRNDAPSGGNRFVAVRLAGRKSNRDAIGARVELRLTGHAVPLLQTLRAGDGFLTQSSKWVHFGLGRSEIEQLVVRWPGGEREVFAGVEPGGRYRLVEGNGRAEPWSRTPRDVRLEPRGAASPEAGSALRIFSAARVPLPRLGYETFDGKARPLAPGGGRPLLLNLWASWCAPCAKELGEFAGAAGRLREAGLEVIALSVDGLDRGAPDVVPARAMIERLGFPFASGMATVDLLEKLQIVNNELFDVHVSLPVPTSLLIDPGLHLAAIYKGAVAVDRVLADARQLALDEDALRRASLPFEGLWFSDPPTFRLLPLAWELLVRGFVDDAREYVARAGPRLRDDPEYATLIARIGYELLEVGDARAAADQYRAALAVAPEFTVARLNLAVALLEEGRPRDALAQYTEALRHSPDDYRVHGSLAMLLATSRDDDVRDGAAALRWAEKAAMATAHREPGTLDALAAAYAETGRFSEAVATAKKALELARERRQDELAEGIESRLRLYEGGRPYRAER